MSRDLTSCTVQRGGTRRPLEQRNMADFLPVVKGLVEERMRSSLLTDEQGGSGRCMGQTDYIRNPFRVTFLLCMHRILELLLSSIS